ncbi:hypothetical protein HN358_00925 [Candidatus Uhrbacteria bacterium]|nr:hypothetical protein [Candidatus Uhrbacteria bacterium]MBT7717448.1 hypothetical protein [Candidatus Uhrbacteria bacterium]
MPQCTPEGAIDLVDFIGHTHKMLGLIDPVGLPETASRIDDVAHILAENGWENVTEMFERAVLDPSVRPIAHNIEMMNTHIGHNGYSGTYMRLTSGDGRFRVVIAPSDVCGIETGQWWLATVTMYDVSGPSRSAAAYAHCFGAHYWYGPTPHQVRCEANPGCMAMKLEISPWHTDVVIGSEGLFDRLRSDNYGREIRIMARCLGRNHFARNGPNFDFLRNIEFE